MCRSQYAGGRRCTKSATELKTWNANRRKRHALLVSKKIVDDVIENQGKHWLGDVSLDVSHPTVAKAYALAVKAHAGTARVSGEPYINHPLRVAKQLQDMGFNHEVIAVALLHDAVEDSSLTCADLKRHGFSPRIITGVDSVTKRNGETYGELIYRAADHPIGRLVKLADNFDNSSAEQIKPLSPERQKRALAKYGPARIALLRSIVSKADETLYMHNSEFSRNYQIRIFIPSKASSK